MQKKLCLTKNSPTDFLPEHQPFMFSDDAEKRSSLNLLANISEILLWLYIFASAFLQIFVNLPNVAPAILALATIFAILSNPRRLFKLPCLIAWMMVLSMLLIDLLMHQLDENTLKFYFFWAILFTDFMVLHGVPGFLGRTKIVLLIFLFCHFIFLAPDPKNPSRLALRHGLDLAMSNSNRLAYWCGFGALSTLCIFFQSSGLKKKLLNVFIAITCIFIMLSTESRGALLSFLIAIFCYVILGFRRDLRTLFSVGLLMCLFGVAGYILQTQLSTKIKQIENRIEVEKYQGYRMSGRTPALKSAMATIVKHPFAGTGKNSVHLNHKYYEYYRNESPHNGFAAIAVHYGLIPTIFYIILWIMIAAKIISFLKLRRKWEKHDEYVEIIAVIVFIFLNSNMSNYQGLEGFFSILYMSKILSIEYNISESHA